VTDSNVLPRSYRLLLRAYPAWYRRVRGDEMLTTLLDAAAPGQARPSRRDVMDLVVGGLRCRLRPPRGLGYPIVAGLVAIFAAFGGLAVAGVLSAPGAPSDAQARSAAGTALPHAPHRVAGPAASCDWCPDWDRGPLRRSDFVGVGYDPEPAEVSRLMNQAHARLAAAGWRVDSSIVDDEGSLHFDAVKGGTAVSLTGDIWGAGPSGVSLKLVVTKRFSVVTGAILAVGFLGGMLAGWLAAVWTFRRFRRHSALVRAAILLAGVPSLIVASTVVAQASLLAVMVVVSNTWSPNYLQLPAFLLTAVPQLVVIAAAVVAATLALVALPCRGATATRPGIKQPGATSPAH
jgi:hypothetical protein